MKYLLRDNSAGFREVPGEPLDGSNRPLRPWALTSSGWVVYDEWKQQGSGLQGIFQLALGGMQGRTPLRAYDRTASQTRRREFETELARDGGVHPECVKAAVDRVTLGMENFIGQNTDAAGAAVKVRCYGDTASGRLGTAAERTSLSDSAAWGIALQTLRGTDVPKILGIHNCIANYLTRTMQLQGPQLQVYNDTQNKVAPSQGYLYNWFSSNATRGRRERVGAAIVTSAAGLTSPGTVTTGGDEMRARGIDAWSRVEGSDFVKGTDMRNLVFGAGRSGTTGELLKAYRTFGAVDDGEDFKQYLLAIVVYLVTGGHHTCHEIFSVANLLVGSNGPQAGRPAASVSTLAREAYVPGKYIKHLPNSYLQTGHFEALKEKYYDIAMLGHLHGTFV